MMTSAAATTTTSAAASASAAAWPGEEHDDPHSDDLRHSAASPRMLQNLHQHHHHQHFNHQRSDPVMVGDKVLIGLSVAGFAWSLLTSIFGMFHVELFLRAYDLPRTTYSAGNVVVMAVNTVAHVLGAYAVDHMAAVRVISSSARSELTGLSGCLFALCFITPFFRWSNGAAAAAADEGSGGGDWDLSTGLWDGIHYVLSLSLYYTGFAFSSIVMASVVNDNHHMSDHARVSYMASGKICNLLGSLVVTRIGLALFDPADLFRFRVFLVALVAFAWAMFAVAQFLISSDREALEDRKDHSLKLTVGYLLCPRSRPYAMRTSSAAGGYEHLSPPSLASPTHRRTGSGNIINSGAESPVPVRHLDNGASSKQQQQQQQQRLHWRQVARDFGRHANFRSWIGMELLLEAQTTFTSFFLKTFVDGLLLDAVLDRTACDWLLSMVRPSTEIVSVIIMYLPIRKYGYKEVYLQLFYWNLLLSSALLYVVHYSSKEMTSTTSIQQYVSLFLLVYPVLTGAVQSAGFHLAQADMVLEMKRNHALEGRYDEPSLAALFMGANALFCRPAESILPITAANVLDRIPSDEENDPALAYRERLLYLLVVPPLVCSVLQIVAWRGYDLTPYKTSRLRDELKKLRASRRPAPGASLEVI
jgi:hypothetical protein